LILAVDTSSGSGSIALVRAADNALVAERSVGSAGPHAAVWLLGAIASLLGEEGLRPGDIGQYALSIGPGSFTGLRIGISTIKGLAWSVGASVAGVCTLRALAMNAPFAGPLVCPLLDARKSEVYTALFAWRQGRLHALLEPSALRPEALVSEITRVREELGGPMGQVLFLGNGLGLYGSYLSEACAGSILAPEPLWHVRASNIAMLALRNEAEKSTSLEIAPLYLRKSEAELNAKAGPGP